MELKGTKTEKNLMEAFAGESMARNKYTYFASVAKKEGYEQLAAIFEETAGNEKEHAKLWFKALCGGSIPDTLTCLDMAASGASLAQIGQTLSDEKVLIPSAYEEQYHPESARHHSYHDPYRWNTTTLTYVLDRQEYLGHTVLCKSIRENFKLKKAPRCNPGRKNRIQKHS